ncbi:ArnT family glycosyltransferase [Kushneria aurantia]|uniref:ArnT family glycosyltransferase n=1 Tax=Kushneria aurantia TaxID=504092 RepID=A0ABV6G2N4_9GAMM|nr:glycosyltransferase family 39 protein [Kushneria aurantia]
MTARHLLLPARLWQRGAAMLEKERAATFASLVAWLACTLAFQLRPLIPIDETRYVSIAWEMWLSHQWWVAHMNGVPYADKPPLLFWLINLGWGVFGVNDWWPRLIMPLASLLGLLKLYRIALHLGYSRRAAGLAPALLMSMLMWWLYSGTLMFDVLLSACLLGAVAALVDNTSPRQRALRIALWLSLALLAKGPAVLLSWLPILAALPLYRERWPGRRGYLLLWTASLAALLVLLGWALSSAWLGGGAYAQDLLWHQSVGRLQQGADHARPFWWYLPLLPLLMLPWSLWPPAWPLRQPMPAAATGVPPGARRLLWVWLLIPLALFSLVSGKQIHYLMPLLPALALLIADALTRADDSRRRLWLPALLPLALGGCGLALATFGNAELHAIVAPVGALAVLLPGIALTILHLTPRAASVAVTMLVPLALAATLGAMLSPLWPRLDATRPAAALAQVEKTGAALAWYGSDYQASFQFAGRLRRPLIETGSGLMALCRWRQNHPNGWVIGDARDLPTPPAGLSVRRFNWRGHALLFLSPPALRTVTSTSLCTEAP